ncbi:MAG: hypothetical protein WC518_03280 [Patescibacteria group bacterium]
MNTINPEVLAQVITEAVVAQGGEASDIRFVSQDAYLLEVIGREIAAVGQRLRSAVALDIDHSFTREQLREAIACYWVDGDFTEANVPLPTEDKKETVVVELLHLGYDISDDDATAEAKKRGYRRATPRETLTLGAKQPDLQRQFPIVAAPTGGRVLYLSRDGAGRGLYVRLTKGGWRHVCRFAVVREPDRIAEAQA